MRFLAPAGRIGVGEPTPAARPEVYRSQIRNDHRLLSHDEPTCDPFPAASGLGFAGFLFLLLKPAFVMGGEPVIRHP